MKLLKNLLDLLQSGVKKREAEKAQIHKVFENSFDAKECSTEEIYFSEVTVYAFQSSNQKI